MEQNKEQVTEVTESKKQEPAEVTETAETQKADKPFAETLAMEMLRDEHNKHKAKNLGLFILGGITAITLIAGTIERQHLVNVNLQNDQEWRELFSSYDYVTQDGDGINNVNRGEQGDLNNGATSEEP